MEIIMISVRFGEAVLVEDCKVELDGPYECPFCGGHFAIDSTFLDQVDEVFDCMYCNERLTIKE